MTYRSWIAFLGFGLLGLNPGCGCGGDDNKSTVDAAVVDGSSLLDASRDASRDASADSRVYFDGSTCFADIGTDTIQITGTVYAEFDSSLVSDGGADSGLPPGRGPRIANAKVTLLDLDGCIMGTAVTATDGTYTLTGPRGDDTPTWLRVEPVPGQTGSVRIELMKLGDYAAFDAVLPSRTRIAATSSQAGITYDESKGWIVVGFNPVSRAAGGEGATLQNGVTHDPAFNTVENGVIAGNRLAPLCSAGLDAGSVCAPDSRSNQIFFPNVAATFTTISVINPAVGTCSLRFDISGVTRYLVFPNTVTTVNVDCTSG